MNEARSPAALRVMIREVRDGVAAPNSLASINTTALPDGALCVVTESGTLWRLNKSVNFLPTDECIRPVGGPGRWLLFGTESFSSPGTMVVGSSTNVFPVGGNWGQPLTANFALQQLTGDLNAWELTAAGGILTYRGPTRLFNVALYLTLGVGDASSPRQVFAAVSHNNDITGAASSDGNNVSDVHATAVDHPLSTGRLVLLADGDTLRAKGAAATAAVSLGIPAYRMIVAPA